MNKGSKKKKGFIIFPVSSEHSDEFPSRKAREIDIKACEEALRMHHEREKTKKKEQEDENK